APPGDSVEVGEQARVAALPTPYAWQSDHEQALADARVLLFDALYDDDGLGGVTDSIPCAGVNVQVVFSARGGLVFESGFLAALRLDPGNVAAELARDGCSVHRPARDEQPAASLLAAPGLDSGVIGGYGGVASLGDDRA